MLSSRKPVQKMALHCYQDPIFVADCGKKMNQFFVDFLVASYGRTNLGKPVLQGVENAEIEKLDLEQVLIRVTDS